MTKFEKMIDKLRDKLAKLDKKYKIASDPETKRAVRRLHRLVDPEYDREDDY